MQSFASEKLNEAGGAGERLAAACGLYVLAQFQQADAVWEETPSRLWMPPLMAEMENLRAALSWCLTARNNIELGMYGWRPRPPGSGSNPSNSLRENGGLSTRWMPVRQNGMIPSSCSLFRGVSLLAHPGYRSLAVTQSASAALLNWRG